MIDIVALLTSIRSLLADPNPESPANQEASRLLVNNKQEYSRRVKEVVELSWKTHLPLS
jgi:ubiquitin-protein ligase